MKKKNKKGYIEYLENIIIKQEKIIDNLTPKYCAYCGTRLKYGIRSCPYCGNISPSKDFDPLNNLTLSF